MLKELSTMALVATISTAVSNNFHIVLSAAQDITAVYAAAGKHSTNPEQFFNSVGAQQKRLKAFGDKVATMNVEKMAALDLQAQAGPFGVMVPSDK